MEDSHRSEHRRRERDNAMRRRPGTDKTTQARGQPHSPDPTAKRGCIASTASSGARLCCTVGCRVWAACLSGCRSAGQTGADHCAGSNRPARIIRRLRRNSADPLAAFAANARPTCRGRNDLPHAAGFIGNASLVHPGHVPPKLIRAILHTVAGLADTIANADVP